MLVQTERPQCKSASRHRALLVRGFCVPAATRRGFSIGWSCDAARLLPWLCCGVEGLLARVQGLGGAGCGVPAACGCQSAPSRPVDRWATAAAQRRSTLPEKTVAFSTQSPCWRSLIQWWRTRVLLTAIRPLTSARSATGVAIDPPTTRWDRGR